MLKLSKGRNAYRRVKPERGTSIRLHSPAGGRLKLYILIPLLVLILFFIIYIVVDNHKIAVRNIVIAHDDIPAAFDGFKILQISDFKGEEFGTDNQRLVDAVNEQAYDIIILTGDFLSKDQDMADFKAVRELLISLNNLDAPVYYVKGENDDDRVDEAMASLGATYIYPIQEIKKGDARIFLTGIPYDEKKFDQYAFNTEKDFTICVTHEPINYNVDQRLETVNQNSFKEVDFDFSISGHTLGGKYRLPLLGSLYSDEYGLFPQESFAYGLHRSQGRYHYISSGLGNDGGFRLFNTPEIVVFELKCTEGKA